jgi:hypothetical protein
MLGKNIGVKSNKNQGPRSPFSFVTIPFPAPLVVQKV